MFPAVRGKHVPEILSGVWYSIATGLQTRSGVDLHGTSSRPEDLGRVAWKIPVETRTKNSKRKFIENAAHGTSSRPEDLGPVAWKIPVETRTKNSKRKFIENAAHGTSSRPEDLGRVAWKIPVETRTKNSKRKFIENAAHGTSSRPEDLGRVAWKIPVETRTKNSKRKFIENAAHGTSSRPEDLGRVAWKILRRNTYKNIKAKIHRERGARFEFPSPRSQSQSTEGDYHVNVLNLPLSNIKHRHTRVRSSLAPIFSTSARLNSLVKPVTTWLLLNLSEQAYHFLFVSNAEEYTRSNTNAISSKCRADHAAARAVTEELIVAQSHQNHKTDKCWQHLVIDQNCGEFLSVLKLVMRSQTKNLRRQEKVTCTGAMQGEKSEATVACYCKVKVKQLNAPQSQDGTRRSIGMTRKGPTPRHQDSAFSWLVAFCGFLSNVIILGCSYSYGVLFPELLQEFHAGKATTGERCAPFTLERIIRIRKRPGFVGKIFPDSGPVYTRAICPGFVTFISEWITAFPLVLMKP